jgi:general secretion pathway protein G
MNYGLVYFISIQKKIRGFTLIEMLIVVIVIGILATAVAPKLVDTQGRARDVKRVADIRQIWIWLSTYSLNVWSYPTWQRLTKDFESSWPMPLVPSYLTSIPRDNDTSPYAVWLYYTSPISNDWAGSYNMVTSWGYYGYTPFPSKWDSASNASFLNNNGGMILITKVENMSMANWMTNDTNAMRIIAWEVPNRAAAEGWRWVGARAAILGPMGPWSYNLVTPNTVSELTQNLCARMTYTWWLNPYMNAIVVTGSWDANPAAGGNTCYVPQTQKTIIRYVYTQ